MGPHLLAQHPLYLPAGRRGQGCTEKTLPALCPLSAPRPLSVHITLPVCPPHLTSGHLHSADTGKGRKNEGLRGGKEELEYTRRGQSAPILHGATPPPSRRWVGQLLMGEESPPPSSDTMCPLRGKQKNTAQGQSTHMIGVVESWDTSGKDRRQLWPYLSTALGNKRGGLRAVCSRSGSGWEVNRARGPGGWETGE